MVVVLLLLVLFYALYSYLTKQVLSLVQVGASR
jgi:hypothetical protein